MIKLLTEFFKIKNLNFFLKNLRKKKRYSLTIPFSKFILTKTKSKSEFLFFI